MSLATAAKAFLIEKGLVFVNGVLAKLGTKINETDKVEVKFRGPRKTLLYFADDGFTVETPRATTKIKSVGRWMLPIEVPAMPLKRLMGKLSATPEITLLYFDGWLSIGSVKLSARPAKDEEA